jgi:hypothetical protein
MAYFEALFTFIDAFADEITTFGIELALAAGDKQVVPLLSHLDEVGTFVLDHPVALMEQVDMAVRHMIGTAMPSGAGQSAQNHQAFVA